MAYTPTEWQTGDVVTSAKLNKLENAVAGVYLPVLFTLDNSGDVPAVTVDKTYAEITAALAAGIPLSLSAKDSTSDSIYAIYFQAWDVGALPEDGYIAFVGIPTVGESGVTNTGIILYADDTTEFKFYSYPE